MSDSDDKHYGMDYMERIDAHIDSSIYDFIEFFLDRGYETEYCCSGSFKDHYTNEELEKHFSGNWKADTSQYPIEVIRPYISLSSIFHDHQGSTSTVDDTVYYLKEALSNSTVVNIYSGERSDLDLEGHQQIRYNFDMGTPYQGSPNADHTYIFSIDKLDLQRCFVNIDRNVEFYDRILEYIFEVIKLAIDEPILGHHTSIHANCEKEELSSKINVRYLPEDIDTSELHIIDDTDVENDEDSIRTKLPRYEVCGLMSVLREELYEKPDQEYIDSLYEESKLDMDPFNHPTQPK